MKDICTSVRRKARLIAEIRYPAAPRLFDMRGKIIESMHPEIQSHFKHWRIDTGTVHFFDDLNLPKQEFLISLKRAVVILEDFGTMQEFVDRTRKYLGLMYDQVGDSIKTISRLGVRLVEICSLSDSNGFDDMVSRVVSPLCTLPEDLTAQPTDALLKIVHKRGSYTIGPVKKDESWILQTFKEPSRNVPNAGIGLDIDSFVTDIDVKAKEDIQRTFMTVFNLTKAVEESLLRHIGLLDE